MPEPTSAPDPAEMPDKTSADSAAMSEGRPAGGAGPNSFVPKPRFEYQAPSMFAQYKYLAIVFVLLIVAAGVYLARAPHKPLTIAPPPVYIEALPERPTSPPSEGHSP